MGKARNMNMDSAISLAALVIQCLYSDENNVEHWFDCYDVLDMAIKKWEKPQRKTLLHEYIKDMYLENQNYNLDKYFPVSEIREMQSLLNNYNIDYSDVGDVDLSGMADDYCDDNLEEYAWRLQDFFKEKVLDILVDDVFSVLFMDKNFLHEFNLQCSRIIKRLEKEEYPDLLKDDGKINRVSYYPKWLKNGIECRDKSHCSICGCDLSSTFITIKDTNFDHIIPLNKGGNNDSSNWQFTCETCNKSKGARNTSFKNIIMPFWEVSEV